MLLVVSFAVTGVGAPSRHEEIPTEAVALQQKLKPRLSPTVREWVGREAAQLRLRRDVDEAAVRAAVRKRFEGQKLSNMDIDALVMLVMMEMAQAEDKDLRATMDQMQEANRRKQQLRETQTKVKEQQAQVRQQLRAESRTNAPKLDSMNEMSEMTSLRLQMTMDRRSKFISTLSNIMKKISTTQETLTQNLK